MKEEGPVSREQLYAEVWAEPMTKARTLIDSTDALLWLETWKTPEERTAGSSCNY